MSDILVQNLDHSSHKTIDFMLVVPGKTSTLLTTSPLSRWPRSSSSWGIWMLVWNPQTRTSDWIPPGFCSIFCRSENKLPKIIKLPSSMPFLVTMCYQFPGRSPGFRWRRWWWGFVALLLGSAHFSPRIGQQRHRPAWIRLHLQRDEECVSPLFARKLSGGG